MFWGRHIGAEHYEPPPSRQNEGEAHKAPVPELLNERGAVAPPHWMGGGMTPEETGWVEE